MASPASTETIEIRRRGRRRLIGAIAIVVLLVVFVPMLLDSEPRHRANEPSMQIPPKENAPPLPAPAPAPAKPATAQATPAAPAAEPASAAAPAKAAAAKPAAKLAVAKPEAPKAAPVPAPSAPRL